jgi:hypothetical protein
MSAVSKFNYDLAGFCTNPARTNFEHDKKSACIDVALVACNKWSAAFSFELPPTHTLRGYIVLNEDSYLFNSQKDAYNAGINDLINYLNRWNFTGAYDDLINNIKPGAVSYSQSTVNKTVELVPLEKKQLTLF